MKDSILRTTTRYAVLFAASALAAAAIISQAAFAQIANSATPPSPVSITNAWAKTTVPGGQVSAAYMDIKSTTPVKLVKVETAIAGNVEIHSMTMKSGVMEMKAVDAIDVPANKTVSLKPGGYHVMLMMLAASIAKGDTVPLKLTFEGESTKTFTVDVNAKAQEGKVDEHKH
jgi:periplasmic copper chaperone A